MGPILSFETVGLRHGTGSELLANLDLSLDRGEIACVRGETGAGKTALLEMAGLVRRPSRGRIQLLGADCTAIDRDRRAKLRRRIGMVSDAIPMLPRTSLADNVALPLAIAGIDAGEGRERVAELLGWLRLGAKAGEVPMNLSRGERERGAIARALVGRPDLILLDEVTIDEPAVRPLLERMLDLGAAVLIASRGPIDWPGARHFRLAQGRLVESLREPA
jgi:cell division transport system ATP-binding protein